MDNAELMESTELKVAEYLDQAHKGGLTYRNLLWILLSLACKFYLKAEAEYQLS